MVATISRTKYTIENDLTKKIKNNNYSKHAVENGLFK